MYKRQGLDYTESGVGIREVQREVRSQMFDRLPEERNLAAFLLASLLEQAPKRPDAWFQEKMRQSQFPELAREEALIEQLMVMLRVLRDEA